MHILFFSDNFPPETNAPAWRTFEHARIWVREGHDVTVVTCVPNFPVGRVYEGYRNRLYQVEHMDGIRVVRVWSYITANVGVVKRILDYVSFMLSAIPAGIVQKRPDIIVSTSPQFFTAVAAWLVSVVRRRPWIFELRDLWPDSIKAVGAMNENTVTRALKKLEYFLYRRADRIVAVTRSFVEILAGNGLAPDKLAVVPNGVDCERFTATADPREIRQKLGIGEDEFVAAYIGTLGMAHGLRVVLRAAKLSRGEPIRYMMVGEGAERETLVGEAAAARLDNILFIPGQPKENIPGILSASNACLVLLRRSPLFETVIPSKIFEAMATATPIILGVRGESAEIVQRTETGICIEPENESELVEAIRKLSSEQEFALAMGENGRRAAREEFDRSRSALQMLRILKDVVKTTSPNRKSGATGSPANSRAD